MFVLECLLDSVSLSTECFQSPGLVSWDHFVAAVKESILASVVPILLLQTGYIASLNRLYWFY